MRLYKTKNKGRYSSTDDKYIIDGTPGKWYSYFTPGGPAARLGQPSKTFSTAEYLCDYHRIIHNSPEWDT